MGFKLQALGGVGCWPEARSPEPGA